MERIMTFLELKLEHKSLASDSKIYRQMEIALKKASRRARNKQHAKIAKRLDIEREECYNYRTNTLRRESRVMNLARGYLRGRNYLEVENKTHSLQEEMMYLAEDVFEIVNKFDSVSLHEIEDWMTNEDIEWDMVA
jgi:hypothetical protein